jgi:glycosyltransferase involved in cell wall biosynthesis
MCSDPAGGEPEYPFSIRLQRALARRFPRARIVWNIARARSAHYLRLARGIAGRFRPRRILQTAAWLAATVRIFRARRQEPRLTVGVQISPFWEPLTGIGWYLYRLLEHLADRDDLRIRLYGPSCIDSPDLPLPVVPLPTGPALERPLLAVPDDLLLPRGLLLKLLRRTERLWIALDRNDVLFAPNYFLSRRFHLARGARVATVHDLGLRKVPWTLQPETLRDLTERLEHSLFEASRLISVSATVRDELAELGYSAPERVTVVHHGPGQLAAVEAGALPASTPPSYGLHVGTLEPRKNILELLDAWRRLRSARSDAPALVLCGRLGWRSEAISAAIRAATREGWLVHLGYVRDVELAALYRRAAVVVFPSLYEGFGLPAVEAHQAGVPLVCSDIPVLREVAGDAALFVPLGRPDLLAAAVQRVLSDSNLREELVARGHRRAADLSWQQAADRTASVWQAAAAGGRSR